MFSYKNQNRGPYRRRLLNAAESADKPLIPTAVRATRYLGRHGSHHLIEVLYRGKRTLRYVRDLPSTPDGSGYVTAVTAESRENPPKYAAQERARQ